MGRIIQQNNGKTTVYVTGENFNTLSAATNTYFVGVDLTSGTFEKKNPNGSVINLELSGGTSFTGGTVNGATTFTNGLSANIMSATTYLNLPVDSFTGGTVNGATNFTNSLSANTFYATTYLNLPVDSFTGGTVSGATTFTNGLSTNIMSATTYLNLPVDNFTGGTVSGSTTFTNGLSANIMSATTYLNLPVDSFTGGTVSGATTFTNGLSANTLSTSNVTCSGAISSNSLSATTYLNLPADIYITGGTYSAGTLTLSRSVLSNIQITGFTNNAISVTYSELLSNISNSTLLVGSFYVISDYQTCYDQPNFDYNGNPITSGNYKQGPVEPIIVIATSNNTISNDAYQPAHPNDKIKYDWSFSATEVTNSAAFGRITERIDEFNNRTDYDHRNILFKRYRSYFQNSSISGRIISMNNGIVTGLNTNFTGDFTVGEVIIIYSNTPTLYEVIEITSQTDMVVAGFNYDNFTDSVGYLCATMFSTQELLDGCLYYFNDVASGEGIDDGGNDMYDGGNYLNTNLSSSIPYTHTRMVDPPIDGNIQASFGDFVYDGSVQNGDTYFGIGSNYFTNLYPGLFVMSAYDVDVEEFYINGNLGADGSGLYDDYIDTISGYSVYGKFIYDAQDPSVNHLIIVNEISNDITHNYSTDTNDDFDSLSGITGSTQIHYLLFGLANGVKPTNSQIQNVVSSYLSLINTSDINVTLSNLNTSFTAVTSNLPANQQVYKSLNFKQNNITGDTVNFEEHLTFGNLTQCINNYIGDYANLYQIENNPFILANNVFYGQSDYLNNKFGDACFNNTFDDDCTENIIGNYFYNNSTDDDFDQNLIGNYFHNNYITSNFQRNRIDYSFYNNVITTGSFYFNEIGNNFNNNVIISGDLQNNKIGNEFSSNMFEASFYKNNIGNSYTNNKIFADNSDNKIGNNFNNNKIYSYFQENTTGEYFDNNSFGDSTNLGAYNFYANRIGGTFTNNIIAGEFRYNEMGYNCYNNIIGDGFGFGGSSSQGNRIGNDFKNNTIGEYFYNNIISDNFYSNTVINNFQLNDVKTSLNNIDFSSANYVYGNYNCTLFKNANGDLKLSYYDASNVLSIDDVNN